MVNTLAINSSYFTQTMFKKRQKMSHFSEPFEC